MGASDKKQSKQLDLQNSLAQQQQAQETSRLNTVQGAVSPYLTAAGQGFSPAQLAAMNSQALDQNAQKYDAATQQVNAQVDARGENGMSPLSGVSASGYGNLQASKAGDLSNSLQTVTLNDAQQNLANRMNAASILSGNAQTLAGNVGTYNSGAASALNNVTTAQSNGFVNNFSKGLGSGLGSGLSAGLTGGLGSAASTVGSGNFGW